MKVVRFSNEIVLVDDKYIALSMITVIHPLLLQPHYPLGAMVCVDGKSLGFYRFNVQMLTESVVIRGKTLGGRDEESPEHVDSKVELLVVRDELLEIWNKYLENKQ